MSKKIAATNTPSPRRFLLNGRAGRHPGEGSRTLTGLHPWPHRPPAGWGITAPKGRKPPKGLKP